MQVSAEIRWFWRRRAADPLGDWFRPAAPHGLPAGGGSVRVDDYLCDKLQCELGIKRRGGRKGVEIKGLVAGALGELTVEPFAGPIELWTKWASESVELRPGSTIAIEKRRWLRKFDGSAGPPREIALDMREAPVEGSLPQRGCNVELTEITLPSGERWATLGLEAFGSLSTVEADLRATAALLLERQPPPMENAARASYPSWLQGIL